MTLLVCFLGCQKETTFPTTGPPSTEETFIYDPIAVPAYVLEEERLSFKFFWEAVNGNPESRGYGMITDRYNVDTDALGAASIASIGFGLAALIAGVENDWIDYQEGYERALGTMNTLSSINRTHGFFYHFLNMNNGGRDGYSEVSIIDTALLIAGCLTAGEYFGGEVKAIATFLAESVEWDWYYHWDRMCFYMGYQPESGFSGYWEGYAEQLIMYVLAAGSTDYSVGKEAYTHMKTLSQKRQYGSSELFYTTHAGTLFTYQFSHAFIDFRHIVDQEGIDWFENSVQASIAAYDYAVAASVSYATLSDVAWGLTASDGPDGYKGNYGNLPSLGGKYIDGTLAPCGAIGSIVFTPELVIPAIENYASIPNLQSKYGFRDAYNLGLTETALPTVNRPSTPIPANGWFNEWVIGIDKGITLLMIENYRSNLIWHYFMQSEIVRRGLEVLEFTEKP
jgi:hypothetical protein